MAVVCPTDPTMQHMMSMDMSGGGSNTMLILMWVMLVLMVVMFIIHTWLLVRAIRRSEELECGCD